MSDNSPEQEESNHPVRRLLDNPWILLAVGLLVPILSYTVWGWVELLTIKAAQLP